MSLKPPNTLSRKTSDKYRHLLLTEKGSRSTAGVIRSQREGHGLQLSVCLAVSAIFSRPVHSQRGLSCHYVCIQVKRAKHRGMGALAPGKGQQGLNWSTSTEQEQLHFVIQ